MQFNLKQKVKSKGGTREGTINGVLLPFPGFRDESTYEVIWRLSSGEYAALVFEHELEANDDLC